MNERERAVRELQGKVQEFGLIESETQSLRRQLDHAQGNLRVAESQVEEMKAAVRASKRQSEEAVTELTSMEEQWNTKNQSIGRLQTQVKDLQTALDESRKTLNERYLTITALNAQLQEYRARASESNGVVSNLQAAFSELSRRLQSQSMKMAETDVRTNDIQFQATIAAEVPLLNARAGSPLSNAPIPPSIAAPALTAVAAQAQAFAQSAVPAGNVSRSYEAPESEDMSQLEDRLVSMLAELKPA